MRKYVLGRLKLSLLVLFLIMGVAIFSISKFNFLEEFRQKVSGYTLHTAKKTNNANVFIKPTNYPWILRKHLSDFTLSEKDSIEIFSLYPESIHTVKNIANKTYRQFTLGKEGSCYELTVEWNTKFPVEIRLFDRLERPIACYKRSFGKENINVFGSVYKMQLVYNGVIDKDAAIFLHSKKIEKTLTGIVGVSDKFEEIPKIKIVISLNSEKGVERLRKDSKERLIALGATGNPIETVNKKVYAQLYHSNFCKSDIRIWQSGQGQMTHFDERSPSLTAKIVSGELFHGIRSFKLYTIKSQQGLLDYVVGHLAENEGLFVPRRILVDVTINDSHAGLYLLEEAPSSEFFAGKSQYDGFIQSLGKTYFKPAIDKGSFDSDNIDTMLKTVDSDKFGKTLALLSRFHGVHGLGEANMRFYLHPILKTYEPILRDININIWDGVKSCGVRELLTYSNFWIGERPFAYGTHYNIKTSDFVSSYSDAPLSEAYTWTATTLGLANIHPLAQYFINIPRFRELFEEYLFYYASEPIEKDFLNILANTFDTAEEFLRDDKDYLEKIFYQAKKQYKEDPMTITQFVYPLFKKSRILVIPYNSDSNNTFYALLNLSAFSVHLKKEALSKDFEIIDKDFDINDRGYFIAPSKFFAMSINNFYSTNDEFTLGKLTQKSIKKILNIEFKSYLENYFLEDVYVGPKPFIRIKVPKNKEEVFSKSIAKGDIFTVAGANFLNENQINFFNSFDAENPKKIIMNVNKNAGLDLLPMNTGEDLLIQNIGQYPIKNGYMIRYLFLNQSSGGVEVDFRRAKDPRIKEVSASLINDDGIREASSHFNLAPMKKGPFKKTTNLWIDNFIPLFNGTQNDDSSNIALVDLYFHITNTNRKEDMFCTYIEDMIADFHPKYLYNSVVSTEAEIPPTFIFNNSFEDWVKSSSDYFLPEGFIYSQGGRGGFVERCILNDDVKDGKASILLKPSSIGSSYLRYQIPEIDKVKGRSIKFSIWVKSENKSLEAIQVDVQDGVGPVAVASYSNSSKWEMLEIEKYVAEDAKFLLLTLNIKHTANAPAYFDNASVRYSDDQFRVKIHEPYNVLTLPHDSLGGGDIDKPFIKISDNHTKKKELIYFKDNTCNDILVVEENQILVLKPGQVIRFSENAGIIVYGQIFAKGNKDKRIELLPQKDKWLGLMVINNNETNKINYLNNCRITGASGVKVKFYNPSGGLSFIKTNIIVKDVDVERFSSEDSVHFYKSNFKVIGLHLSGGIGDGIDSDWGYGKITKSYFNGCGGDCVDISGSLVEISDNKVVKAYDKGISVGEGSTVSISNNEIDENTIGIAIKDQSTAKGSGNKFRKNTTAAIALYIKKPDYIQPNAVFLNSEFYGNKRNILKADFNKVIREYDK